MIRELGTDQFELTVTGVQADGKPLSAKLIHSQQGGIISGLSQPENSMAVQTVIGPGDFCTTFLQNGKQVRIHRNIVSKDGKTMTETEKGTDSKGQPFEAVLVYDKQ